MTVYDPEDWLVTAPRVLKEYIESSLGDDANDVTVEMNFPDTSEMLPLPKTLIHMEVDDIHNPVLGFGTPAMEVVSGNEWYQIELQVHEINLDIGVWASAESGGASHRALITQKLIGMFMPPAQRLAFREATGMWVVSFTGGRNERDRINDIPVWRALDITLVLRLVSQYESTVIETLTDLPAVQDPELTITNNTGDQSPVT